MPDRHVRPGRGDADRLEVLGLRAVILSYTDPFARRRVRIEAPTGAFRSEYGFGRGKAAL